MRRFVGKDPLAWAAVATVAVCLLRLLVGGIVITAAQKTIQVGALDGGVAAALLGPTLGAYVASRHRSMRPHEHQDGGQVTGGPSPLC